MYNFNIDKSLDLSVFGYGSIDFDIEIGSATAEYTETGDISWKSGMEGMASTKYNGYYVDIPIEGEIMFYGKKIINK
mgnify:FL=1